MVRTILGVLTAAVMAMATTTMSVSAAEYKNDAFDYRIHFPDTWSLEQDAKNDAILANNAEGSLLVAVQAGKLDSADVTADKIEIAFSSAVFDGWEKMGSAHDELAGLPGTKAIYKTSKDGVEYVAAAFYIVRYQTTYVMYAIVTDPKRGAELLKQADDIFRTFRCCGN